MKKIKLLLIDDDVAVTDILKIGLEDTSRFEVAVENNASKALA